MVGQAGQGSSHGSSQGSREASKVRPGHRRVAQWTRGYARLPGIPDEYIGQDGAPAKPRPSLSLGPPGCARRTSC